MLLILSVAILLLWGHMPIGWIGCFFHLGIWFGLKVAK